MRTSERLRKLKQWIENELCEGREMKAPAPDMDITKIVRQKPQCFLAWQPTRRMKRAFCALILSMYAPAS